MATFKGSIEKTTCGGTANFSVAQNQVTTYFKDTKPGSTVCTSCPLSHLCNKFVSHRTIQVYAFTGMTIGELPITNETKSSIEVTTARGKKLKFDKKTLLQTNATNPKFANRIAPTQ